jgi:nucleoside-diphosphate-sugar epimerase
MTSSERVLLCGCGWLGKQLIAPLQQAGIAVSATSRDLQKVERLAKQGVDAAPFSLGEVLPKSLLPSEYQTTAVLMLPPGRRNKNTDQWETSFKKLIDDLLSRDIDHIIFISSTSVYGDSRNEQVIETSPVAPETASAKAHVRIEQYLQSGAANKATILRLAGLVGNDRHPINTLSGRQLTAPNKLVNLVHGDDIVSALTVLISLGPQSDVLHLCSQEHPQRKRYYDWCAKTCGLEPATFTPDSNELPNQGKWIDASATWERLGITPRYPSPFDMINQ